MTLSEDERLGHSDPEDILAKVKAEVSKFRVEQTVDFIEAWLSTRGDPTVYETKEPLDKRIGALADSLVSELFWDRVLKKQYSPVVEILLKKLFKEETLQSGNLPSQYLASTHRLHYSIGMVTVEISEPWDTMSKFVSEIQRAFGVGRSEAIGYSSYAVVSITCNDLEVFRCIPQTVPLIIESSFNRSELRAKANLTIWNRIVNFLSRGID